MSKKRPPTARHGITVRRGDYDRALEAKARRLAAMSDEQARQYVRRTGGHQVLG